MNHRQKKKQYKKKYGAKNVNEDKQLIDYVRILINGFGNLANEIVEMANKINRTYKETVNTIQEMPLEEFEERLNLLSLEQKELVLRIRNRKQEG